MSKVALNLSTVLQQYHEDGARIEAAFRRYIHRADPKQKEDSYEIIVCHANVIRYFVCRFVVAAAQLKPLFGFAAFFFLFLLLLFAFFFLSISYICLMLSKV